MTWTRVFTVAALVSLSALTACDDGTQIGGELVLVQKDKRALKVLSVRPEVGPIVGGTLFVMTGEGFEPGMSVAFGEATATQLYVGGDELAAMLTPPGAAPGAVDLVVTRPSDGQSATVLAGFTYLPPPADLLVTEVIPSYGPVSGGNVVTIAGQGFAEGATVWFGDAQATNVRLLGAEALTVTVPAGTAPISVPVRVALPTGAQHTLNQAYAYQPDGPAAKLKVTSVIPGQGPLAGGNLVAIEGNGFVAGATVTIGGKAASDVRVLGLTAITCVAPAGSAAELVEVRVTTPAEEGSVTPAVAWLEDAYRYLPAEPNVLAVLSTIPAQGALRGGSIVAVRGSGFVDGAKIFFGGALATDIQVLGPNALTAVTPAATVAGPVDVRVENPGVAGQPGDAAELPDGYTYLPGDPDLLLLRAIPNVGPANGANVVTLEGAGFRSGAKVFFDGAPATEVAVLGPTAIACVAPANAVPGLVSIRVELPPLAGAVTGPATTLDNAYTYQPGNVSTTELSVLGVIPGEGSLAGGNFVAIRGTGFITGAKAFFGGVQATQATVLGPDALTCMVPAGTVAGAVAVRVENPPLGGTAGAAAALDAGYTYHADSAGLLVLRTIPGAGPVQGGNVVAIEGMGFRAGAKVWFGGAQATEVQVLGPTALTALAPQVGAAGMVAVRVELPPLEGQVTGDAATLDNGYNFTLGGIAGTFSAASLFPASGDVAGGTLVLITGTGFDPAMVVRFGAGQSPLTQVLSASAATAIAPVTTAAGVVDVTLVNPNAQVTLTGAFRYTSADTVVIGDPPALGAVTPGRGPVAGGTIVRIVGGNFDPALRVFFGDAEATTVTVASSSEAAAVAPAGAAGPVAVRVQNPDGKVATLANGFVYGDPTDGGPAVTSTWPTSGPSSGGTWVTVDGQRLTSGSRVWFGLTPAASTRWVSDGRLIAVAPPNAVGTVAVTVVRADGAFAAVPDAFAYYDIATLPGAPPVVSSVFPGVGTIAGGDAVAVLGSDFEAGTRLYFDAEQVTITESATTTKRGVTTPAHAAGSVAVTAVNPNGLTSTRSGAYVYYAPPPLIIGVSPSVASTSGGSEVTITGKNFVSGTVVELGDATITSFNQRTGTALKFFAPTHAAGTLDVVIRNPDGQLDRLVGGFTYVPDEQFSSPVVIRVDPPQGVAAGGYIAVIHGQSFASGAAVTFGGVAATNVQLITPETITAVVPAGQAGTTVAVKVANSANKVGTLADAFTYTAAPVGAIGVRTVSPGLGSLEGGTVITVTGEGFETGSVVTVGGVESPAVAVISPTVLTAVTPAGAEAGLVDVQVRRPDFSSATAYNAFAYYDPATYGLEPAVFATDPVIGPMTGGTAVLITGARFAAPAIVFFGAREATSVTVLDGNRIVARTPLATLPGTVAVSVMSSAGLVGVMPGGFSYYDASGAALPIIGGLLPNEGSVFGGTSVTVVGQRLSRSTRVYICDRPAVVTAASGSNLSIVTPGGDAGPCRVTAVNSDGLTANLVDGFKYVSPNPTVTDVIPQIGPIAGGIDVVVRGASFVPGADVRFGNSLSPLVVVADAETLTAKLPVGQLGPVDVTVINPGGKQGTLAAGFTYVDSVSGIPPIITLVAPATGPVAGGTPVRVLGQGFSPDALLLFDQMTISDRQFVSANEIRFTSPPGGGVGSVPITILNPNGLGATVSPGFTYANPVGAPPAITSIVPSTGREAGGTTVTITGSGFSAQGTWTLGGKTLENVATVTGSLVTARTPAGTPGKKDLVYVAPDGRVALRLQGFEYLAAPVLTAVTPALGNKAGGTEVNLLGDHFNAAMEVYFGQNRGQVLSVSSESTALVRTPTAPIAGKVDVRVKNPDGQEAVLAQGFEFLDTPTLTSVWPPSGPTSGGTLAWVNGTGFHPQSQVTFGGTSASSVHFQSATLLLAFAPGGTVGPVDVKVVNPDGREVLLTAAFVYTDPATLGSAPYIGEIFPARGPTTGGTKVSLDGAAFQGGARVAFLPAPATIDFVSQSRLIVTAPPHPTGPATVWLTNPDGQSIRALEDFTYIDPALLGTQPVVSNMNPTRGPTAGGTAVTLTGNYFQSGARVRFGPLDGQVTATTAQQLSVLAPQSPKGSAAVMIVNPDGTQTTAPAAFLFLPPPTILAINPSRVPASGNVAVTISGMDLVSDPDGILPDVLFCTNFSAGTDCVQASASYLQANSAGTQLSLLAPAHTPALTDVVVRAPDGQTDVAPAAFTFSALPSIVSIAPDSGPTAGGTVITLRGTNFQQGAQVSLGTKACTETVVEDATTVKCKTPAGAAGPVDVILTNADTGAFSLAQGFTYVAPPQIVSMIPNVGPEDSDTPIVSTITGFNFKQGLSVYIGATLVPAADTTVNGTTTIRVNIPTGGHGSNDVKVVNPDGQISILLDGFTYIPPLAAPQANFVTPALGTTLGGDVVKIAGLYFLDGVRVYFGAEGAWFEASGCAVRNNGTLITCLSPAHDAGVTDVRVVNTDGQEARLAGVFEFIPPAGTATLKFFSIEPTRSILQGGGRFTLSGEGFKNGVNVRFIKNEANVTFATNIVRLGPTLITGTLPPAPGGVAGKVTVRITNPATSGGPDIIDAPDAFEYVDGPVFVRSPGDRLPNEPHNDVGVVIFDVNGDGLNDVLVFTSTIDRLLINNYEGRKGSFQAFDFAPAAGNFNTVWAVAKDFDEDGDIDIIRHQNYTRLQFCANDGGGSFPTCVDIQGYYPCNMRRFITDDFNCDGHLDLFLPFNSTSSQCQNRLLVGFGNGKFVEAPPSTLPALLEETQGAAAADIDKDNDIDLVLANDNNVQSRLFLNNCSNIQETGQCMPGIPNFTNLGYGGHAYAFSSTTGGTNILTSASWDDARAYCQRFGYDLVRIDDAAEDAWLRTNGPFQTSNFWTGYRAPNEAPYPYAWSQTEGTSTYEHWCTNEPNNQGSNYLCAYYQYSSNPDSRCWNDYPCGNSFQFVCEAPKPQCATGWQFSDAQYGAHSAGKTFPISATNARDVLFMDVDNDPDHYPDVIIASWGQPVNVFINQGGRFLPNDFNRWPLNEANPYIDRLLATDIDGDGDVDIVAQAANNEVRIYANQLAQTQFGAFANETPVRWPNGNGFDSRTDVVGVAVGDLDGDLYPDVYIAGGQWADRMVMNRGYEEGEPWIDSSRVPVGEFRFNTYRAVPERRYDGRATKFGDLNGDGFIDLVKVGWQEPMLVYLNDGAGKFIDVTDEVLPAEYRFWTGGTQTLQLVDVDGDGDLDIFYEGSWHPYSCSPQATPCSGHLQLVNRLNETGKFEDVTSTNLPMGPLTWASGTVFADFDQDGDVDWFLGAYNSSQARVFINGGDVWNVGGAYFFDRPSFLTNPNTNQSLSITGVYDAVTVNLNGDQYPDLFLGTSGQNIVLLNKGGTWFDNVTVQYANTTSDNTRRLLKADFDQDGDEDLVIINQDQQNRYLSRELHDYANITASSFIAGPGDSAVYNDSSRSGDIGDLDLDDDELIDFVVANYGDQNRLWINQGSGQFLHLTRNLPWDQMRSYDVYLIDLDGDGDLDIYWTNEDQDRVYMNTIIP